MTMEDIKKALEPKSYVDPRPFIPEEYHDLIDMFEKQNADRLPPIAMNMISRSTSILERPSDLAHYMECLKKNSSYYDSTLTNTLQKASYAQVDPRLLHRSCSSRSLVEAYNFA